MAGGIEAPGYCFRIGGARKSFVEATDRQIDALMHEFCGWTAEEIKIVEEEI